MKIPLGKEGECYYCTEGRRENVIIFTDVREKNLISYISSTHLCFSLRLEDTRKKGRACKSKFCPLVSRKLNFSRKRIWLFCRDNYFERREFWRSCGTRIVFHLVLRLISGMRSSFQPANRANTIEARFSVAYLAPCFEIEVGDKISVVADTRSHRRRVDQSISRPFRRRSEAAYIDERIYVNFNPFRSSNANFQARCTYN